MSAVNITNVTVLDNPAAFLNPFQFEISYECLIPLQDGKISEPCKACCRFFCVSNIEKITFMFFYLRFASFRLLPRKPVMENSGGTLRFGSP